MTYYGHLNKGVSVGLNCLGRALRLQVADSWSPDPAAPSTVGTDGLLHSSLKPSSQSKHWRLKKPLYEGETSLQA